MAVDIELGGWQEQLILTLTSEGVSITHTLDGQFDEANNAEKAMSNLKDGLAKLGQTSITPAMCKLICRERCLYQTVC